jgi:hypothetical protein
MCRPSGADLAAAQPPHESHASREREGSSRSRARLIVMVHNLWTRSPSRPARSESHLIVVVVVSLLRGADSLSPRSLAGAGQLVATNNISRARRQSWRSHWRRRRDGGLAKAVEDAWGKALSCAQMLDCANFYSHTQTRHSHRLPPTSLRSPPRLELPAGLVSVMLERDNCCALARRKRSNRRNAR